MHKEKDSKAKNVHRALWAILLLLFFTSACSVGSSASGASNFYMTTDKAGTNRTNIFSPTDDFNVFFDVNDIESGTTFQSRWYVLDVEGYDPNAPFQTIDYVYQEGVGNIYFQLTSAEPWPVGNYKVEVYMNDTEVGEQEFSVQ